MPIACVFWHFWHVYCLPGGRCQSLPLTDFSHWCFRKGCVHRVLSEEGAAATREAGSHLITALCRSAQTEKALAVYEDMVLANTPVATAPQLPPLPHSPLNPTQPPPVAEAIPLFPSSHGQASSEICSVIPWDDHNCCMHLAVMVVNFRPPAVFMLFMMMSMCLIVSFAAHTSLYLDLCNCLITYRLESYPTQPYVALSSCSGKIT